MLYWDAASLVRVSRLQLLSARMAELSDCDRGRGAVKPKTVTLWDLKRKQPSPGTGRRAGHLLCAVGKVEEVCHGDEGVVQGLDRSDPLVGIDGQHLL